MLQLLAIIATLFLSAPPAEAQCTGVFSAGQVCGAGATAGAPSAQSNLLVRGGRPWCDPRAYGATGNGVTDDTAALNSCVSVLDALGGGTMYISSGVYCVSSSINISTTTIRIVGAATFLAAVVRTCGTDTVVFKLDKPFSSIENLTVFGKGIEATGFGATQVAVWVASNCVSCKLDYDYIVGGYNAVLIQAPDVRFNDTYAASAYGNGNVAIYGVAGVAGVAGVRITGSSFDQSLPVQSLTPPYTISAWAGTTPYAKGDVVTNAGYTMQATAACTSGNALPALKNYNQNIVDNAGGGNCVWLLGGPTNHVGLLLESGSSELLMSKTDITGDALAIGVAMRNSFATSAPFLIHITDSVIGATRQSGIIATAGSRLTLTGTEVLGCVEPNGVSVLLQTAWTGTAQIANNNIACATGYGIGVATGINTMVLNNYIHNSTICTRFEANITDFQVMNNNLATGCSTAAVSIAAGTSNRYYVAFNTIAGATMTDGGTGTSKLFQSTDAYTASVFNGGTGLTAGTSGGIPYFSSGTTMASSAALGANQIVLGGGAGTTPATLGSLGTTTTVLHGNAGGAPSFAAITSSDLASVTAPTVTVYTSGSGTHTTAAGAKYIVVEMMGGGGGGSGSGTTPGAGTTGNASTFGTLTANGGANGGTTVGVGGAGGTVTNCDVNQTGGAGGGVGTATVAQVGGNGGVGAYGGAGYGGIQTGGAGFAGATNSGGGGGGGAGTGTASAGGGGGSGGYCRALIASPSASYSYAVGASAAGGAAGTSGAAGGAGAAGRITVTSYFQ